MSAPVRKKKNVVKKTKKNDDMRLGIFKDFDQIVNHNNDDNASIPTNIKPKTKIKGVVNVKKSELVKIGYPDLKTWLKDKDHVYIGRNMSMYVEGATSSIWKNPFKVAKKEEDKNKYTLDDSLDKYRIYIESTPELMAKLSTLKGKVLGCWCKPARCHGDVLMELVEKYC